MKNKIIITALIGIIVLMWLKNLSIKKESRQNRQELKKELLGKDSLVFYKGIYSKYVADTLTKSQIKKLTNEIIDLKKEKPLVVEKIVLVPKYIEKKVDSVEVTKDSIHIQDFYPNKKNYFVSYSNSTSVLEQQGKSKFKFQPITIDKVVSDKGLGLYRVDFKVPDWLKVESIDIQTEPVIKKEVDKWGTIIGVEYGKNLDTNNKVLDVSLYKRYKKIYLGCSVSSNKDLKAGLKIEL